MMHRHDGFSLVELVVAVTLMLSVMSGILALLSPSSSAFLVQSETSDLQQRARVAADALSRDLASAGAGGLWRNQVQALNRLLAPVIPRVVGNEDDAPETFRGDAITVIAVPQSYVRGTITTGMAARSGLVTIHGSPECVSIGPSCGFAPRMRVLLFDDDGLHDLFTIRSIVGATLDLRHDTPDSGHVYPAGSSIVEVTMRSHFLRRDPVSGIDQLARRDAGGDVPVADHVVGLSFDYFGDPMPPRLVSHPGEGHAPVTSYGPVPPGNDAQISSYPPGENCLFRYDGGHQPRLPTLNVNSALVQLTAAQLTDGPWCPDATHPARFDADLLRIRRIAVNVRMDAAIDGLRGPEGALFSRGGTSRTAPRLVRDFEVRFQVSPRNLGVMQ
jgi:type II secretory pathway pseudopilin PulG